MMTKEINLDYLPACNEWLAKDVAIYLEEMAHSKFQNGWLKIGMPFTRSAVKNDRTIYFFDIEKTKAWIEENGGIGLIKSALLHENYLIAKEYRRLNAVQGVKGRGSQRQPINLKKALSTEDIAIKLGLDNTTVTDSVEYVSGFPKKLPAENNLQKRLWDAAKVDAWILSAGGVIKAKIIFTDVYAIRDYRRVSACKEYDLPGIYRGRIMRKIDRAFYLAAAA